MANHNQSGGLRRIWNAGLYSLAGIRATWKNEAAFRQELLLCAILLPGAFVVGQTAVERALLIGSCMAVLVVHVFEVVKVQENKAQTLPRPPSFLKAKSELAVPRPPVG